MSIPRTAFFGACQIAGAFGAFYAFFLATDDPAHWLARAVRLRH